MSSSWCLHLFVICFQNAELLQDFHGKKLPFLILFEELGHSFEALGRTLRAGLIHRMARTLRMELLHRMVRTQGRDSFIQWPLSSFQGPVFFASKLDENAEKTI